MMMMYVLYKYIILYIVYAYIDWMAQILYLRIILYQE